MRRRGMHSCTHGARAAPCGNDAPPPPASPIAWTMQQHKQLEAMPVRCHNSNDGGCWDDAAIAAVMGPGITGADVQRWYEAMVAELRRILEAPGVETPPEWDLLLTGDGARGSSSGLQLHASEAAAAAGSSTTLTGGKEEASSSRDGRGESGRNKAVKWTTLEHKKFLEGLEGMGGAGDWKTMARLWVPTKTPAQIASHCQKYRIRQETPPSERERKSIHDISSVEAALALMRQEEQEQLLRDQSDGGVGGVPAAAS